MNPTRNDAPNLPAKIYLVLFAAILLLTFVARGHERFVRRQAGNSEKRIAELRRNYAIAGVLLVTASVVVSFFGMKL